MNRKIAALSALGLAAACSAKQEAATPAAPTSIAAAQTEAAAPPPSPAATTSATPETPMPPPMITGGFAPADTASADVKAALALATDALYKKYPQRGMVEKSTAEVQVVAGLNYRFDIQMTGGKHYTAIVYKPLKGDMAVSSVDEAK